jgi:hypothetical protein
MITQINIGRIIQLSIINYHSSLIKIQLTEYTEQYRKKYEKDTTQTHSLNVGDSITVTLVALCPESYAAVLDTGGFIVQ